MVAQPSSGIPEGSFYTLPTLSKMVVKLQNRVDAIEAKTEYRGACGGQTHRVVLSMSNLESIAHFLDVHRRSSCHCEEYVLSHTTTGLGDAVELDCATCGLKVDIRGSEDW